MFNKKSFHKYYSEFYVIQLASGEFALCARPWVENEDDVVIFFYKPSNEIDPDEEDQFFINLLFNMCDDLNSNFEQ